jgi:hypothetical protein
MSARFAFATLVALATSAPGASAADGTGDEPRSDDATETSTPPAETGEDRTEVGDAQGVEVGDTADAPNAKAAAASDDWSDAPPADQASGIAREEAPPASERARSVTRAVLFVPRMLVWTAAQPIRGGAYVYERYNLPGVFRRTFFSVDEKFGIYPTGQWTSGFGGTLGGRLVHRDLFGADERLKLRAGWGGQYRYMVGGNLRSGRRLGRVALEVDAGFERRPNERFFGIGNANRTEVIDMPYEPSVAVDTRFREDLARVLGRADFTLGRGVALRLTGAWTTRTLAGTGAPDSIEHAYMTEQLVGWPRVETLRGEVELVYDSRRPTSRYQSAVLDATGWYASVHGGAATGVDGDPARYGSAGGEVQRLFDLYRGSRILAVRLLADTVIGGPVPFLDLPRLGGNDLLRGYPWWRFRDRAIGLAAVEYSWDLGNFMAAYTFVDVGRAYPSLAAIDASELRVGFGGGIQLHTMQSYLGRVQLAASRDGDVFFEVVLSPQFARRERVGRF